MAGDCEAQTAVRTLVSCAMVDAMEVQAEAEAEAETPT